MSKRTLLYVALASLSALSPAGAQEDGVAVFAKQKSLTGTPGGPREQLRRFGISPDVWVTQFYQGQPGGDGTKTWAYGGKLDAFLKVDAEKLGLWQGLHFNAQYEHYIGRNINGRDFALLPVNTAQAFIQRDGYHSALSLSVTQDLSEHVSVSAGKFNMMTLAAQTPLVGGGGIDTFMNRAFAAPSTGIGVSSPGTLADRLVASPPYLLGGAAVIKTKIAQVMFMFVDPRNAQNSRVLEHPFERGVAFGGGVTIPMEIAGLRGWHTLRAAYSNARGFDLEDIGLPRPLLPGNPVTKKSFRFASYAIQQNFFQSETTPGAGWGLFTLATLSDGNPTPVKWSMTVGLAGNNLLAGREEDRWGVGYYHYGFSKLLLAGLAERRVNRSGEGGVEAFYNFAITPAVRLTADLQVIDPWNPSKARAAYTALRLQTKF